MNSKAEQLASRNVDLSKLFLYQLPSKTSTSVLFLEDYPSDHDLLDRELIVRWLYNAIRNCTPQKSSFVIGISGQWGSGKTTVLNLVTSKIREDSSNLRIIIVDTFNPWIYSDEQSLLLNMMDTIIKQTGYNYSVISTKKLAARIISQIGKLDKTGIINLELYSDDVEIGNIKRNISEYLDACNLRMVFLIDNLDRLEDKNVLSILSFLSNVVDIDRITYVLSYDKDHIQRILRKNVFDVSFLDKIVNMEISVPEVTDERKTIIIQRCLSNYVKYHNANIEIALNSVLISTLCAYVITLRSFVIFLNSVMARIVDTKDYLNLIDLIGIEIIQMFNPSLYNKIYANPNMFISTSPMNFDNSLFERLGQGEEKWKKQQTLFYEDLFKDEENKKAKELVEYLFPIASRGEYDISSKPRKNDMERRICSRKYFQLYFTFSSNYHLHIDRNINSIIEQAENIKIDDTEVIEMIEKSIDEIPEQFQSEFLRGLQLRFNMLTDTASYRLTIAVYNIVTRWSVNYNSILSVKSTAAAIISDFFKRLSDNQFQSILKRVEGDYSNLYFIDLILYFYRGKDNSGIDDKYNMIKEKLLYLGNHIIKNNINLYDDLYYSKSNIWGFIHIFDDHPDIIKNYISSIMKPEHVFRLISDCISEGHSSSESEKYLFNINRKTLNLLTTIETIDRLLEIKQPTSESEMIIKTIYTNFRNRANVEDGTSSIDSDYTSAEPIEFIL